MGAAGVMDRGGVAAAGQMTVAAAFLDAVSNVDFSFLQGEAGDARNEGEVMAEVHGAEGKKGLALTFREEPTTAAGGGGAAAPNSNGTAGAGVDERSDRFLVTGLACEAGMRVSVGLDFFRAASEEVLVTGVVVWESGVEPGGVWRTESRKEKVCETGLRLSPVISDRLSWICPAGPPFPATASGLAEPLVLFAF